MTNLQFVPFDSRVNPDFWLCLSKIKLEVLKLKDEAHPICGRVELTNRGKDIPPILDVDRFSFDAEQSNDMTSIFSRGFICNQNTIEKFKNIDKSKLLEDTCGQQLRESIMNGSALDNPCKHLGSFLILTFADLKKYNFYFWFAFPGFQMPPELRIVSCEPAPDFPIPKESFAPYFVIINGSYSENVKEAVQMFNEGDHDVIFGYLDSCTYDNNPGWSLRNYLSLILYHSPGKKVFKILSRRRRVESKLMVLDYQKSDLESFELGSVVGWEKNENGKLGPRVAAMKAAMDPKVLAESSVDLNLKLMKWRVAPDLDLDTLSKLKVLLLGSGTLGCNVARVCLGWGIRHITFVDNSRVSFSNPVRQTLYEFNDCLEGGQHKAKCASEKLKAIFPGVTSNWHDVFIPMPGHPISDSNLEESKKNFEKLDKLIQSHDVVYLLTDSRESRWLPTVMGAHYEKIVMNAALGFDTFLVLRHGMSPKKYLVSGNNDLQIPGNSLGCYFCNDVVAPGDSLKDRTLDQQCTVTRPGMSFQAASIVVELSVSLIQHEKKGFAPAGTQESESVLGLVPHSVRGSMNTFSQFCPTTPAFDRCTACSQIVLKEFAENKFQFIQKVCNSSSFLEDITGLTSLLSDANLDDIMALNSGSEDE